MTDQENLRNAEKRGYQRGYAAGKKRLEATMSLEEHDRAKSIFWQRAFLAALPAAIEAQGWTRGEVPITGLKDRVVLAVLIADSALQQSLGHLVMENNNGAD